MNLQHLSRRSMWINYSAEYRFRVRGVRYSRVVDRVLKMLGHVEPLHTASIINCIPQCYQHHGATVACRIWIPSADASFVPTLPTEHLSRLVQMALTWQLLLEPIVSENTREFKTKTRKIMVPRCEYTFGYLLPLLSKDQGIACYSKKVSSFILRQHPGPGFVPSSIFIFSEIEFSSQWSFIHTTKKWNFFKSSSDPLQ